MNATNWLTGHPFPPAPIPPLQPYPVSPRPYAISEVFVIPQVRDIPPVHSDEPITPSRSPSLLATLFSPSTVIDKNPSTASVNLPHSRSQQSRRTSSTSPPTQIAAESQRIAEDAEFAFFNAHHTHPSSHSLHLPSFNPCTRQHTPIPSTNIANTLPPAYNFTEQSSLLAVVIAVDMMMGMLAGFLSLSHRSQRITAALGRISDPPNHVPFVNDRLINSFSYHTIGTHFDTPILNINVHNPHEKTLVYVISPTGRKRQASLPFNQLHYFIFTRSFSRDLFTQHYINFFTLFGDEIHLIGISSSLDTQFEYDGSVPTIRVVSNPAVDFRFIDADGDLRSVYFDQQRLVLEVEADVFLKRTIQRAVDARIILRFVDGQEADSKMDGVDCEWADKSDIGSNEENSAEDGDEDAHNEEETEEGDRDSYDPHFDLKSEHSLDSIGHIQHLFTEQASNSDTDDALSSDKREIVQKAHPQRRRNVVSRYNRNYNTSLTPKYPVQPLFTTVSLRLVKVRTICTVRRDERNG
ncbi:hypothetical protein BLNAU_24394 [Blattamonas nauphoetae]|uniref:Uncharacterized protein n=1 Tax=Blattamonas nauphoetae TaxID=2049346 RepID=A0ABQ9WMJ4_9EUKA|nr:hypothetical protein BLNAU_24394 [Blattamonas nauphoetae]